MKLLKILIVFVLVLGLGSGSFCQELKRTAKIIALGGKVEVKPWEGKWTAAAKGMILKEGDILRTKANSWAHLNLNGRAETATVEVKENSQLLFRELLKDKETGTQATLLDLALGKVLIKAKKLDTEKSKFEVKTPTSTVGVRGTSFSVEVEALK